MCSCQGTEMLRDEHTYRTASDGFRTRLSSWTRLHSALCFDIQTVGIAQGKQRGFAQRIQSQNNRFDFNHSAKRH